MTDALDKLTIRGFKSIRALENFELKKGLNILIGANGAGKSNFVSFFKLMRAFIQQNLGQYVELNGGADDLLFNGREVTEKLFFETRFGERGHRFSLTPLPDNTVSVRKEARYYAGGISGDGWWELGNNTHGLSNLTEEILEKKSGAKYSLPVYEAISAWQLYHFHYTGPKAGMRHYEILEDDKTLRVDAANIAPFLLSLKTQHFPAYQEIVRAIRLVMPFFDDFILTPRKFGEQEKVNLSWHQKGSDYPMQPYHLSDGSIRFICLATALLQPNLPSTIIIDEPELGLHPAALVILAELIELTATRTQVIVATQSPALIDQFAVEDIIVVNRKDGASTFARLKEADFSTWLENYSVGELWTKNVIAGGPVHE